MEEPTLATEQEYSQTKRQAQSASSQPLKPRGIGMAVVLDWGVAAELALLAPLFALGIDPGGITASFSAAGRIGEALVLVGIAAGAVAFGEALRRGVRPVWMAQVLLTCGLAIGGLFKIPDAIHSAQSGQAGTVVSTVVLAGFCPVIAWMLTRKATRTWVAQTTSAEARQRHGGRWLAFIIVYALISGALIAFSPLY
jgi:hypothetical protein